MFQPSILKQILIFLIFRYNHIYEKNTIYYIISKYIYIS